jgi:hypothetical protein
MLQDMNLEVFFDAITSLHYSPCVTVMQYKNISYIELLSLATSHTHVYMCVYVYVCVCVCVRARVCMCLCVRVRTCFLSTYYCCVSDCSVM